MQRTIDRSIKVTEIAGPITNAFDEILKPTAPLTEVELRTERGKPVVDEPLDEEKAKRKAQAAREGRQTTSLKAARGCASPASTSPAS